MSDVTLCAKWSDSHLFLSKPGIYVSNYFCEVLFDHQLSAKWIQFIINPPSPAKLPTHEMNYFSGGISCQYTYGDKFSVQLLFCLINAEIERLCQAREPK